MASSTVIKDNHPVVVGEIVANTVPGGMVQPLAADQQKRLRTIATKVREHGIGSLNENEKTFVQFHGAEFGLP